MQPRYVRLLIVFVAVFSLIGAGYALTKISFNNTSQINAGQNIFITQPSLTPPGSCPADGASGYTQTISGLFWNLTAGSNGVNYYFCMDNQGPVSDPVSITAAPATVITSGTIASCPSTGSILTFVVVTAQSPLAGHSATATPDDIEVCAGSGMTPSTTGPTFTITIA